MSITPLNNYNINYEIVGNPKAPDNRTIIFAHGNGNCLDDWQHLGYLDPLEKEGFRLILMDALGYGASDKPLITSEYTAERRAADVVALLDKLSIKKCHFFGSSIGGSLGFVLASLYPNRFLSYMLGMAHAYGSTKEPSNVHPEEVRKLLNELSMEKFVEHYEVLLGRRFPNGVRENFIKNDAKALIAANSITWPDYSSFLSQIKVPVLMYAGEYEEQLIPYVKECCKIILDCTFKIIPSKNHAETYWDGKDITDLLINFLNEKFSFEKNSPNKF